MQNATQRARRQIEFYFSDTNFARDKHLQAKALENDDGFIDLEHINTFERMKRLGLTVEQLADALKDSDVVELNADKTKVKRKHPLPEVDTTDIRTLYIKGFPKAYELDQIQDYIENSEVHKKQYKSSLIRMRRFITSKDDKGNFKGSVLVTFPSIEDAEEFWKEYGALTEEKPLDEELPEDCTPDSLFKHLLVLKSSDWIKGKKKGRNGAKSTSAPNSKKSPSDEDGKKGKNNNNEKILEGTLVKFDLGEENKSEKDLTREIIKEAITKEGLDLAYIDYKKGDKHGHLRFKTADDAKKAVEKKTIKTEEGHSLNFQLLDSEETRKYMVFMKRRK